MLNYSCPPITVTVGSFNLTPYLVEIALSEPMAEYGDHLGWQGRFRVQRVAGHDQTELDQWLHPTRWRTGQQQFRIEIGGELLPTMRIDRYQYDSRTGEGEGSLVQIIGIPGIGERAEGRAITVRSLSGAASNLVGSAVNQLLQAAFDVSTTSISPTFSVGGIVGEIYGPITSRSPIQDAARLAASSWRWLAIDNTETLSAVSGEAVGTPIFTRAFEDYEWERNIDSIGIPSSRIIVTGRYNRLKARDCDDLAPDPTRDGQGRPSLQKTDEFQPFSVVFDDGGTSTTPTLAARKWIFYSYPDEQRWDSQLWGLIPGPIATEIQSDQPLAGADPTAPSQTVTIEQWPAGRIFPDLGTSTTLYPALVEVQSERRKVTYRPAGRILPDLGQDFDLVVELRETLTTTPVLFGRESHAGEIDPRTGKAKCLEPAPKPEPRQVAAEQPIEEVPTSGSAAVAPVGYVPVISRPAVRDLGFIPLGMANYLAAQLALREERRRNSIKVKLPIPAEWLAAGCPPLATCELDGDLYQIEGPAISISANSSEAFLEFSAGQFTRAGVAIARLVLSLQSQIRVWADLATSFELPDPPAIFSGDLPMVLWADLELVAQPPISTEGMFRLYAGLTVTAPPPSTDINVESMFRLYAGLRAQPPRKTITLASTTEGIRALATTKALGVIGVGQLVVAFKLDSTTGIQLIYEERGPIPGGPGPRIQIFHDGSDFVAYTYGGGTATVAFGGAATDWHELAISVDGSQATFKIDSATATVLTYSLATETTMDVGLGSVVGTTGFAGVGSYAMYRLFNTARTYAQYHCEDLDGTESGALAVVRFTEGTGTTAVDLVSGSPLWELYGGATWGGNYTC
jgi:hypothetical protein